MKFAVAAALLFGVVLGADVTDELKKSTDDLKKATAIAEGAKWCPAPLAGTECPPSSVIHYYKCCGTLANECCFVLQYWVLIAFMVIGVVVVASLALSFLRCIFCRRK